MHIGVADQRVEDEAPDEFGDAGIAGFAGEHAGDQAIGSALIFLVGIDAKDLRKILDMHEAVRVRAVEPLYREGRPFQVFTDTVRQPVSLIQADQLYDRCKF